MNFPSAPLAFLITFIGVHWLIKYRSQAYNSIVSSVYCIVCSSLLLPLHLLLSLAGLQGQEPWNSTPVPTAVSLRENKPDSSRVTPSPWLPMAQEHRGRVGGKVRDGLLGHLLYFLTFLLVYFFILLNVLR